MALSIKNTAPAGSGVASRWLWTVVVLGGFIAAGALAGHLIAGQPRDAAGHGAVNDRAADPAPPHRADPSRSDSANPPSDR